MNKRFFWLDLASGIMTIWVLYFHALYPIFDGKILDNVPWLYFFMPWFFYKSGMMFHHKDVKTEWHNGVCKLLRVYLIWSVIGYIAHICLHLWLGDLTLRLAFYTPLRSFVLTFGIPINGALWFLPVLFLVRQVANWLLPKAHVLWIIAESLILCILLRLVYIPFLPNAINGTIWGLFFFTCGYWLKVYEEKWWLIVVAIGVYVISVFTPIAAVYGGGTPLWSQLLWYPSCAFACVLFNNLCRILITCTDRLSAWKFPILRYVGHHAMNFYVPHYMIFGLVFSIIGNYSYDWYSGWQGFLICTITYAVVLPLTNTITIRVHDKNGLKDNNN